MQVQALESVYKRRGRVTTMELILVIEIIVLTALACLLLYLLIRDRRRGDYGKEFGRRTEYVFYPETNPMAYGSIPTPRGSGFGAYGAAPYPGYPAPGGYNTGDTGYDPRNTARDVYGGYPRQPNGYTGVNGLDAYHGGYGGGGYMTFPAPVIGNEKTYSPSAESGVDLSRSGGYRPGNVGRSHGSGKRSGPGKGASGSFRRDGRSSGGAPMHKTEGAVRRHPRWLVDFMEMSSGRHVRRDFQDRLVVGRQMPGNLESGRLYLSMDATVSRAQFCLYVTEDGVMIENLSRVNITRKNGHPVWQPVRLDEGDILELGRMRYMVKEIRPAA